MLLGALVAAGAPAEWLKELPRRLGIPDVTVEIHSVDRCGIRATKVNVVLADGSQEHPSELIHHPHAHPHSHDHDHAPHRHVGELLAIASARSAVRLGTRSRDGGVPAAGRGRGPDPRRRGRRGRAARSRRDGCPGRYRRRDRRLRAAGDRPHPSPPGRGGERVGPRRARQHPGAGAGHRGAARGHRDRQRRSGRGRGDDADRRRAPARAFLRPAAIPLADTRGRRVGRRWPRSRGLSQRAASHRGRVRRRSGQRW